MFSGIVSYYPSKKSNIQIIFYYSLLISVLNICLLYSQTQVRPTPLQGKSFIQVPVISAQNSFEPAQFGSLKRKIKNFIWNSDYLFL